ncbi:MAG: MmcQ/YjbR family DNA-binding protein [Acidobacteriota bacterium]|nr:MmcQ/YjbR family DNA-binding protein [Acidobacteriota bacterium]
MTADDFRRLAMALAGTTESAHMGHPDFRINGKIFATLHYPDENWGMVKLSQEHQDCFVQSQPNVFVPVKGAWGRQGSTSVRLAAMDANTLEQALRLAWSTAGLASKAGTARKRSFSLVDGKTDARHDHPYPSDSEARFR